MQLVDDITRCVDYYASKVFSSGIFLLKGGAGQDTLPVELFDLPVAAYYEIRRCLAHQGKL
jgi:hypothetical protein